MRVIKVEYGHGIFVDVPEGAWIQPIRRGFIYKCCDCGLKHRMDFRIHKGRIQFRVFRVMTRKKRR